RSGAGRNGGRRLPPLVDRPGERARRQPHQEAYAFLVDGEAEEVSLTYGELDLRARAIGAWLQEQVPGPGRPVLLLCPPGLDFIASFFGCLYRRSISVPTHPPHPRR